jgi:hypothetical protein
LWNLRRVSRRAFNGQQGLLKFVSCASGGRFYRFRLAIESILRPNFAKLTIGINVGFRELQWLSQSNVACW